MGLGPFRITSCKTSIGALALTSVSFLCLPPRPSLAQTALAISPATGTPAPGSKFPAFSQSPQVTIRVYNYARLDSGSLSNSEKVAGAIFRNIGIEPVWVDCPTSKQNAALYQACDTPMGPADFVLRILPRGMAGKLPRSEDSLGSAQTCSMTEPACELNVFYHRIDELAAKGYRGDRILGYAIAHEVAHILLGPKHSDEGILRALWTPSDLDRISLGLRLDFTGDQQKQLRTALRRRTTPPAQEPTIQANLVAR